MFAFAIWDAQSQRLFLARDPMGIKPLYYFQSDRYFVFASEVRTLLGTGLVPRQLDEVGLLSYLTFGSVYDPFTLIKGASALPPGNSLVWDAGSLKRRQYSDLAEKNSSDGAPPTDQEIYSLIDESVRMQLVSDVPVGVFLSGGIDSSALAGILVRSGIKPSTFSIVFREADYSEAEYSRAVAQHFQTDHHAVRSRLDQPSAPGYSSSGTVVAVDGEVKDIRVGDRVACAGAGYAVHAEYANIPRLLIARIPEDSVSFEEASFSTVGAVCLHGIRTSEVKLGDTVAVIGLGLLGQLTSQMLRAAGCTVLGLDILPERANLAMQNGAHAACSSSSEFRDLCQQHTHGAGVDSVLITAETPSSDPVNLSGEIARDRAIVVAVGTVGLDIQRKTYYEKELDFRISRSYGPGRYDAAYEQKGRDYPIGYVRWTETRNMEAFLRLLAERKLNLDSLITHRFPIDDAEKAYRVITGETRDPFLGVVISYPGSENVLSDSPLSKIVISQKPVSSSSVSVGVIGAGLFAQNVLLPQLKSISGVTLAGVCTATSAHNRHADRKSVV